MGEKFGRDRHQPPGCWVQTTPLLDVAGVQFHKRDALAFADAVRTAERRGWPYGVTLEHELSNPKDRNAIKVVGYALVKRFLGAPARREWHVGYVPREVAAELVEDLVIPDESYCAELYGVYLGSDGDFVDIEFFVLVPKGSSASMRKAHRHAKTALGPTPPLTAEQRRYLKGLQLGLYRNTRLEQAEALRQLGDYAAALDMYLRIVWLDQNGATNTGLVGGRPLDGYPPFDPSHALLAPGIVKAVAKGTNSLGLDLTALRGRFVQCASREIDAIRPLQPVVSAEDAWDRIKIELFAAIMSGTRWRPPKKLDA